MRRIHLGGLLFDGGSGDTTYTIESDSVRGWLLDGVDMRLEQMERPAEHGSFSLPGYLTGRSISWGGLILTDGPQEQEHAMRALSGLLANGLTDRLTVENNSAHWADVKRAGEFDMRMRSYGRVASYRVQLWAANPRIYGEVRDFPAGAAAIHYGNFPATPRLLVGAGTGGYTVTGAGGRVVTVTTAPAGAHEIDFTTGGLYLGGVRQVGAISVFQPWTIPPGLPGVTATITGARSLVQRVTDTFM